ncbi:MAG: hypothetical protein VXZ82_21605 [Planctomycetota bacterium]|nr:hypothetical protein [Planctomycetota bacterium]
MKRYYLLLAVISAALVGCGTPESEPVAEAPENPVAAPADGDALAGIDAKLAAADALDGKEDKQIGKCYVCALGMDGKAELAVEVKGYTACMCSQGCKEHFSEKWEEVVAATDVPNE